MSGGVLKAHRRWKGSIAKAVVGELDRRSLTRLWDHLRACEGCRAHFDRLHDMQRALEQSPIARVELSNPRALVIGAEPPRAARRLPAWSWSLATAGALGALVLAVGLPESEGVHGELPSALEAPMRAKGSRLAQDPQERLELSVLCDARTPEQCSLDRELAFGVRSPLPGSLTLFGIDGSGELMYYAPTPAYSELPVLEPGDWQDPGFAVRLELNHEPGLLWIFALRSEEGLSVDELQGIVSPLRDQLDELSLHPERPWHEVLAAELVDCQDRTCASAWTTLNLGPGEAPSVPSTATL